MTVKNQNKLLKVQNCALCMITYSQLDKPSHEATRQAYTIENLTDRRREHLLTFMFSNRQNENYVD